MTPYSLRNIQTVFGNIDVIIRGDGAQIPTDPANTDYQQYLEWLAAGNQPEEWNPDVPV